MTTTATWWYDDECSSSLTLSISSAALRPVRAFSTRKPRAVQTRYGWRAWTSLWNPAPVDDRNCDTTLYGIKDVSREKTKRLLVNVIDARGFLRNSSHRRSTLRHSAISPRVLSTMLLGPMWDWSGSSS